MKSFVMIGTVIPFILCVSGISIEGQLTVIRNDCYERLALGEKLSPKQTYKTFEHNTVSKCEMECTQEKEACRAYSFGIGPKGNGTCLLSHDPVKETADLKPIGTIRDTDYDLYIKKLDCQIVLEPPQKEGTRASTKKPEDFGGKPVSNTDHHQQNGYGVQEHHGYHDQQPTSYGNLPAQSNYHSTVSNSNQGYHYDNPSNYYPGKPPPSSNDNPNGDGLHHVQTAVSIASGYQTVLHPVHDILVSGDQYGQIIPSTSQSSGDEHGSYNGNMHPFRPTSLNHPYSDHGELGPESSPQRPLLQGYESGHRPDSAYGDFKPLVPPNINFGYEYGYDGHNNAYFNDIKGGGDRPHNFNRPYSPNSFVYHPGENRPDPDHGHTPFQHNLYGDGSAQLAVSNGEYQSYNKYNSFESEEHRFSSDISKRYDSNYNFYDHYEKPSPNHPSRYGSVIPHPNDYGRRPDPLRDYLFIRPNSDPYKPPSRPDKPEYEGHRPLDYDRPDRPRPRPGYVVQRPVNEDVGSGYDRPEILHQPHLEYDRRPSVSGSNSGYGRPDRPSRPNPDYIGENPADTGGQSYDKHPRPNYNSNKRPDNSYNRPDPYQNKPSVNTLATSSRPPSTELSNHYGGVDYTNKQYGKPGEYMVKGDQGERKVVSHSTGYNGEKITSIITELRPGKFQIKIFHIVTF